MSFLCDHVQKLLQVQKECPLSPEVSGHAWELFRREVCLPLLTF